MIQLVGIKLKLRLTLENHVILIHLRIHRADLPLTESVIQSVVDGRGRDSESRSGDAVNHQRHRQSSGLLIGCDVLEFWQLLQAANETVGPIVQFVLVGIFEGVLILRPANAIIDGDVLHRLHEQLNPLHLVQL